MARDDSTALVLGDPKTENPDLPRLNYAVQEANLVAELFSVEPYTGETASEVNLKSEVGTAGVLHLAVHGGFKPGAPLFSRLWLSPGGEEDGRLNIYEVYGLDLGRTDLVVLSACETGLGEVRMGEGVFGLRRAFHLAGARTVVMSLWKVPDEETSQLMLEFYKRAFALGKDGPDYSLALHEASLAMMKSRRAKNGAAHPFFWGSFIPVGVPE